MARYERDYGRDFGRWGHRGPGPIGGMRSDGWGGSDWRDFPGEAGWYGEGYEGMPNQGFGRGSRDSWQGGSRDFRGGFQGGYGGRPEFDSGFEGDFGGSSYDRGYRGNWGSAGGAGGGYGGGYGGGGEPGRGGYGGQRGYGSDFGYQGGGYGGRHLESGWGSRETGYEQGRGGPSGGWGSGREAGLGPSRASEIMTENPETVTADSTISEVARKMRDLDVGIIPVVESEENRRLRGVITDRDVTVRAVAEGRDGETKVGDCMTDRVRAVNKNDSIHEVMRVMREEQVRRVPVTDREGRLVGIIAQADLAVDFAAGQDRNRDLEVGETLERISEPARPERSGNAMAAGGRGSSHREKTTGRQSSGSGDPNRKQETAE